MKRPSVYMKNNTCSYFQTFLTPHSGAVQVCQHGTSQLNSDRHRVALSPLTENCQDIMFCTFQKQLPGLIFGFSQLEKISKSVHVTIKQEFLDRNGKTVLQSFCNCHLYDYYMLISHYYCSILISSAEATILKCNSQDFPQFYLACKEIKYEYLNQCRNS